MKNAITSIDPIRFNEIAIECYKHAQNNDAFKDKSEKVIAEFVAESALEEYFTETILK